MSEKVLKIYTDGACRGNPGPGGWGAVMIWEEHIKEISGFESFTTNNRMEMMAAIEALKQVMKPVKIHIYTDSQYLKKGITEWVSLWQYNNWNKGRVKNKELWIELLELQKGFTIEWHWVKGHNGNRYNERADTLATEAIEKYILQIEK